MILILFWLRQKCFHLNKTSIEENESTIMKIKLNLKHSQKFLELATCASIKTAIRAITHENPLLVFWIDPAGHLIDALNAHHDNPPNGDRSVLSDKNYKGFLRGRAAKIGDKLYIVVYGTASGEELTRYQHALLRRSYVRILDAVRKKNPDLAFVEDALFITEMGKDISV